MKISKLFFSVLFSSFLLIPIANASEVSPTTPREYVVPSVNSFTPKENPDNRTCRQLVDICDNSCKERGLLLHFVCRGEQVLSRSRYQCICGDDNLLGVKR